jgi:predicted nucleotidyltransferase
MDGPSPTIDSETASAARVFTDALAGRFDVFEARLFGSRARGTHTSESDVDVAVVLRGSRGDFLATKLAMADIAFDAMLETGLLVEPLPIWSDEWARPEIHRNPRLLENIAREGVRL